jgi:hypothetical protein
VADAANFLLLSTVVEKAVRKRMGFDDEIVFSDKGLA